MIALGLTLARESPMRLVPALCCLTLLCACEAMSPSKPQITEPATPLNSRELDAIMLRVANPKEAVTHFQAAVAQSPRDSRALRGLALSMTRAGQGRAALPVWDRLLKTGAATHSDRLTYAESLLGAGEMATARKVLDTLPPTLETYKRYLLEAILADDAQNWTRADSFYRTARDLTPTPAPLLNNWGMSKLARGDNSAAAALFEQAIEFDPTLFAAKNNLITAHGKMRRYTLPVMPMSETEQATLLHNLGVIAARQGDVPQARALFERAIALHPRHYPQAAANLAALNRTGH